MNKSKEQEFDKEFKKWIEIDNELVFRDKFKSWHDSQLARLIKEMEGELGSLLNVDYKIGIRKAISILRKEL